MKSVYLLFLTLVTVVFLGFLTPQVHANDVNGISIQNISVQPYAVKVGDTITVTATLVNNSTVPIFVSDMINRDCQGPFFTVSFDNHVKVATAAADDGKTCSYVGLQERLDPGKQYAGTSPGLFFTYTVTKPGIANVTVTFPYGMKNQTDPNQSNIDLTISKSFLFTIYDNNTNISMPYHEEPPIPPLSFLTPLKQLKSGVATKDVTCKPSLQLILKAENNSPICVTSDTAITLLKRGWAKEVSQTSLYTIPHISSASCDVPYPQSNTGVAVLYMAPNSTGKICATYHNPDSPTQSSISVFIAKDMQQQASEITTSVYPDIVPTGNSTIVYTIKTGSQAGFYGISFFCESVPFAVGYDNQSRIILDDFPWLYKNDICLSQTNVFQITGLSGIHVKYVTEAHRG